MPEPEKSNGKNVRVVVYLPPLLHKKMLRHDAANLRVGQSILARLALQEYLERRSPDPTCAHCDTTQPPESSLAAQNASDTNIAHPPRQKHHDRETQIPETVNSHA